MNFDRNLPQRFLPTARTTTAPQRILVAEDDEETRDVVVTAFLEEGHDVYGLDGEAGLTECLGIIAHHRLRAPDLIAVGVGMAWHSGVDIVEGIRSAGWETPVVLMTWTVPRNARYIVERAGATALVAKPFNLSELHRAARRARQQHTGPGLARTVPVATHPMVRWSPPGVPAGRSPAR